MIPELEYKRTKTGWHAQMACAIARIECTINVYEGGYISGSVELVCKNDRIKIHTYEATESVQVAIEENRKAIERWFSQKWEAQ